MSNQSTTEKAFASTSEKSKPENLTDNHNYAVPKPVADLCDSSEVVMTPLSSGIFYAIFYVPTQGSILRIYQKAHGTTLSSIATFNVGNCLSKICFAESDDGVVVAYLDISSKDLLLTFLHIATQGTAPKKIEVNLKNSFPELKNFLRAFFSEFTLKLVPGFLFLLVKTKGRSDLIRFPVYKTQAEADLSPLQIYSFPFSLVSLSSPSGPKVDKAVALIYSPLVRSIFIVRKKSLTRFPIDRFASTDRGVVRHSWRNHVVLNAFLTPEHDMVTVSSPKPNLLVISRISLSDSHLDFTSHRSIDLYNFIAPVRLRVGREVSFYPSTIAIAGYCLDSDRKRVPAVLFQPLDALSQRNPVIVCIPGSTTFNIRKIQLASETVALLEIGKGVKTLGWFEIHAPKNLATVEIPRHKLIAMLSLDKKTLTISVPSLWNFKASSKT